MKFACLFTMAVCGLLSSCATSPGEPAAPAVTKETPSVPGGEAGKGLAPRSIAGTRLAYTDLHSRNVYHFSADGKYVFEYVHVSGSDSGEREGRYQYRVTSPDVAVLDCGDSEVITLRFDSATTAIGTIEGDVRKYLFRLSVPAGN